MRALLALPCSLGGLNVVNPIDAQFSTSKRISAPLVDLIFRQEHQLHDCYAVQQHIKSVTCQVRCTKQKELAGNLYTFVSSSTLHWFGWSKGSFELVDLTAHQWPWVCTTQISFPGCTLIQVQLAPQKHSIHLQLRSSILSWSCPIMSNGRFSNNSPRWGEGHDYISPHRSLSQCFCRTPSATSFRGNSTILHSYYGRQC